MIRSTAQFLSALANTLPEHHFAQHNHTTIEQGSSLPAFSSAGVARSFSTGASPQAGNQGKQAASVGAKEEVG